MVENQVISIFNSNLSEYIDKQDIGFFPKNRSYTYILKFKDYIIEIYYEYVDSYYRIKIEFLDNNEIIDILLLSKTFNYKKQIYTYMKKNKLSKKSFLNHMIAFTNTINEMCKTSINIDEMKKVYNKEMKYDGIFI